ncbi:MAG: relaxase domain-containing protein [Sulfurimonas sp.]|nr:relaxase domain-containing protein [Sulfurimonas sp.]
MNSEQAAHYHKQEQNYYQSENIDEAGKWFGKAAQTLGLKEFKFEEFERLCHGIHPTSEEVLVDTSKRAGTDLTFSAPKSVSVLCEVLGDEENKEIRNAHDRAVEETLRFIEENYIQTRHQKDGVREVVDTGNIVAALFQHDTSRELDPQLHTHAFVLNMTQREDGKFRALFNEQLFENKMLFGQIYRNHLAQNLKELHYEIEVTSAKKGLFEVKGVSEELLSEFSTRAQQTKIRYEELKKEYPKMEDAKLKEMAALDSRKSKDKNIDRKAIKSANIQRAEALEDISVLRENIKHQQHQHTKLTVSEVLERAIEIKTDKESVFSKEELLKEALKLSISDYSLDEFLSEIQSSSELVNLQDNLYTTQEMMSIEIDIVKEIKAVENTLESVVEFEESNKFMQETSMTTGQKQAANFILNSKDIVSVIQGDAGVGKTYMLNQVNEFIKQMDDENKPELVGLAYTGQAASEIEKEANIKSQTLHSFLNQKEFKKNQIYLVDESGMIGSKQLKVLMEKAKENGSKIVLIGDQKQFQTLSAGAIFQQLQSKSIVKVCEMTQGMRAKTQDMKELYAAVKNQYLSQAYEMLEKTSSIKEIDAHDKYSSAINEYLSDRKNTLLIASSNMDRSELNDRIRVKLNLQGGKIYDVKESVSLSDTEKHFSNYYKAKQLVMIEKAIVGARAGTQCEVISVDSHTNSIRVKTDKKEFSIDLKKYGSRLQTYELNSKEFAVDDLVTFTKNDKKLGVKNGEIATVKSIRDGFMTLDIKGKALKVNMKEYSYLDYAYCVTQFKSQGQTASKVIAFTNATMTNLNSLYVSVTRAKNSVKIYTDDIKLFKEKSMQQQQKTSTLDHQQKALKLIELNKTIDDLKKLDEKQGLYKDEKLKLQEAQIQKQQLENEQESFLSKIKKGHELYDKVERVKNAQNIVEDVNTLVKSEKDLDYIGDMLNHNIKDIDSSLLSKFKTLSQEILKDSLEEGFDFKTVLKTVVSKQFTQTLEHANKM